jgi:hypothetical protein
MGENDRQMKYNDIDIICRDAKHVDQFIARANSNGTAPARTPTIRERMGINDERVRAITS